MLDETALDALPVPVFGRLRRGTTLLHDGPDDPVQQIEQLLALLRETPWNLVEEALVNGLRILRVAVLGVEAIAPELIDVLLQRRHRVNLLDVVDSLGRLALPVLR